MIFDMLKSLRSVVYLPGDYVCKKVRLPVSLCLVFLCVQLGLVCSLKHHMVTGEWCDSVNMYPLWVHESAI